jgi:hypothetical protein
MGGMEHMLIVLYSFESHSESPLLSLRIPDCIRCDEASHHKRGCETIGR